MSLLQFHRCFSGVSAVVAICFVSACSATPTDAQSSIKQPNTQNVERTYTVSVPNYASLMPDKINQTTDNIMRQQEVIKADLFAQLKQGGLSDGAKAQLLRLMGEFKVYQSVDILVQEIDFRYFIPSASGTPVVNTATHDMGDGYFARQSLLELGNTSYYTILEVVGSQNKEVPFDPAKVDGYCWVMNALRGSTCTIHQLKQQLAAEKNPKVQAQYRSVLDRMKVFPAD